MRLSQSTLFQLCCASFLAGALLSIFWDFLYAMRLGLMPTRCRYSIPAIQKLYTNRIHKGTKEKKKGLQMAIFFGDVLFCLVSAITVIFLLYWLNNGAFRAAALLCMALGFYLCRISISKGACWLFQWMAFGVEALAYVLCVPFKRLFAIILTNCKKNAQKRHFKHLLKQRKNYTKQVLRNVDKTLERFLPINSKSRMQKGNDHARKSKKAV